jgi:hypothetical protein
MIESEYIEDDDPNMKRVKRHAAQLCEHFDNVQIMVSKMEGSRTITIASGEGNYSARYGLCAEWVKRQEAQMMTKEE